MGRRGGLSRGKRLSATDKKRIASLGGKARAQSLQAARRIVDNFRYVAVLGDLRRRPTTVRRLRAFARPAARDLSRGILKCPTMDHLQAVGEIVRGLRALGLCDHGFELVSRLTQWER